MSDRACPRCGFSLRTSVYGPILLSQCGRCLGAFFRPGDLAKTFGEHLEPGAWRSHSLASQLGPSSLSCPDDLTALERWELRLDDVHTEVDTCPRCKGLWLDAGELGVMKQLLDFRRTERQSAEQDAGGARTYLLQLFTGVPIEVYNPVRRRPWLLMGLVAVLVAVFLAQLNAPTLTAAFALVPNLAFGSQPVGFVTHIFLHAGAMHLLGNLYFMWIFGDNLEDAWGPLGFAMLFFACGLVGGMLHVAMDPNSGTPMVGASGAISGLMGAYAVMFPRVQVWVVWFFIRFKFGMLWYLALRVMLDVVGAIGGTGGVAWFAHVGGFATGALVAYAFGERLRRMRSVES